MKKEHYMLIGFILLGILLIAAIYFIIKNVKKKRSNEYREKKNKEKKLADIDDFLEIKSINEYDITLKDETKIIGLKILPKDLFVEKDEVATKIINQLSSAWASFNFPIWHAFVFTPNTFSELDNYLLELINSPNVDPKRVHIANEDRKKLKIFSQNQYQLEFFIFIKGKDEKKLLENYDLLISELERPMQVEKLTRYDFYNYVCSYFDVDENVLSEGLLFDEQA